MCRAWLQLVKKIHNQLWQYHAQLTDVVVSSYVHWTEKDFPHTVSVGVLLIIVCGNFMCDLMVPVLQGSFLPGKS